MRISIRFWPLLFLSALLLLWGCSEPTPRIPRLPPDAVILAFGDSLTSGTGAKPEASYPAMLARLSGYRVINAGLPGELSAQGRQRLPRLLDAHDPDLVILMHGGNDMLRQYDLERTAENLRAMVNMARASGATVVLVGVPKPGFWLNTAQFYREIAEELDLPLEDGIVAEVESNRALKSDTIHPNAEGYRRIAEAISQLLRNSGAL